MNSRLSRQIHLMPQVHLGFGQHSSPKKSLKISAAESGNAMRIIVLWALAGAEIQVPEEKL